MIVTAIAYFHFFNRQLFLNVLGGKADLLKVTHVSEAD